MAIFRDKDGNRFHFAGFHSDREEIRISYRNGKPSFFNHGPERFVDCDMKPEGHVLDFRRFRRVEFSTGIYPFSPTFFEYHESPPCPGSGGVKIDEDGIPVCCELMPDEYRNEVFSE